MSSDYRSRGGGGRRRRGGRGRGGQGYYGGENRLHSNGSGGSAPKKKSLIQTLLGWFSGKKKTEGTPGSGRFSSPRPDFKDREREPRAERPRREDRPKAEFVPQEIVSPKLYVGNLSYEAVESDLFDLFSKVGAVKNVEIAMDRRTNRSKGFGFVEMETLETAKEAAAKLNRTDFMSRQIVVSGAKLDKRPSTSPHEADANESESNPGSAI
ncbi:MAG: RNA-binding protein [Methylacidiphilales bacterium]|nr:RNA-binding protein [Candidatus Methylacidiphilales bacterium]